MQLQAFLEHGYIFSFQLLPQLDTDPFTRNPFPLDPIETAALLTDASEVRTGSPKHGVPAMPDLQLIPTAQS